MWRFAPFGDRALLVTIGNAIDPALLGQVLALDRALRDHPPPGLLAAVAAYASLLCRFDPTATDPARLEADIRPLEGNLDVAIPSGPVLDIPTRYDGPDLDEVAGATNLAPAGVIAAHAAQEYLVYCIGFAPGFTYCGPLPDALTVPRRSSPRLRVPAGSVAIAGHQTGIYAVASPGGWNLIGRTAIPLFDASGRPPARLKPGDRIRFVPER